MVIGSWLEPVKNVRCLMLSPFIQKFTLRTGFHLLDLLKEVQRVLKNIRFPFLIFHGSMDRVVPLHGSQAMVRQAATHPEDKELVVYEGAYHYLMLDPVYDEMEQEWLHFIDKRLKLYQTREIEKIYFS